MLYRDRVLNVAGSVRLKSSVTPDAAGAAAGGLRVQREAHVLQDVGVEPDGAEGALQVAGGVVDAVRMLDHLEQAPLPG
jgi:hypothetical protein